MKHRPHVHRHVLHASRVVVLERMSEYPERWNKETIEAIKVRPKHYSLHRDSAIAWISFSIMAWLTESREGDHALQLCARYTPIVRVIGCAKHVGGQLLTRGRADKKHADEALVTRQSLGKDVDLLMSLPSAMLPETVLGAAVAAGDEDDMLEKTASERLRRLQMVTRAAFKFGGGKKAAGAAGARHCLSTAVTCCMFGKCGHRHCSIRGPATAIAWMVQARSRSSSPSWLARRVCSQQVRCLRLTCSGGVALRATATTGPQSSPHRRARLRRTQQASVTGWTRSWTGRRSSSRPSLNGCVGAQSWLQVNT